MQWPVEEVGPVSLKDRLVKRGEHVEVTGLQTAQVSAPTVLFPFSVSSCAIRVAFSSKTKKQKHPYSFISFFS
jgi:hypothetical protein